MNSSKSVADDYPSSGVAWRVTLLLTVAYMLSFVDRQVVNLLVDPIQSDLQISDTQVSLLQGFAFIITYIVFSIPLGRLADTHSRKYIVAGGVFFWSLATATCGLANSFKQLFVARAAVGMGEAALTPAAWSMMADYFPPERRSFPISIFLMGPYLGAGLSMIAGGALMGLMADMSSISVPVLGDLKPWQVTFMLVGLPGILVALMFLGIKEPKRKPVSVPNKQESSHDLYVKPKSRDVLNVLKGEISIYLALLVGIPMLVIILYGLQAWVPSMLIRGFNVPVQDAGFMYGLIALFSGSTGVLSGPFIGRWLEKRGRIDYPIRIALYASLGVIPALMVIAFSESLMLTLLAVVISSVLVTIPLALAASTLQNITPSNMRGLIAGIYVVMTSGVGMGLGPTLIALCTDYIVQDRNAVGLSMASVGVFVALIALVLFIRAMKPFRTLVSKMES